MTIIGPGGPGGPLNRNQKTTALALRSLRSSDDVRLMQLVSDLIELEARPATIEELTGVNRGVARKMYEREVMRPMTGRRKSTIGDLLVKPRVHLEITFFLQRFATYWMFEGGQVQATAFVRAYRQYVGVASPATLINAEAALALAQMYHRDELHLARCEVCGVPHARSREVIRISWSTGHGDCPLCRSLTSKDPSRSTLVGHEIRTARKTFERLLATGHRGPVPDKPPED
jgi:hypothetical protein